MKFEAKLFQIKYHESMKLKKTVEEMCENNVRCPRIIFLPLRTFVFNRFILQERSIAIFHQMRRAISRATRKSSKRHSQQNNKPERRREIEARS